MKIILLNGPSQSGKDTTKNIIFEYLLTENIASDFVLCHDKFSAPIKLAFAAMMEADIGEDEFTVEGYENDKEKVIPLLGVSYRRWQIDFSEKFMKPLYGQNVFGRMLISRLTEDYITDEDGEWVFVISDCGFQIEIEEVLKAFKPEQVMLIRLHREGKTYEGDSREEVFLPNTYPYQHDVANNGTLDDLANWLRPILQQFGLK